MDKMQEEIFFQTKKLTGTINLIRIFFYTVISSLMLIIVLALFNMFSWQMALIVLAISAVYSFLRDYAITKYTSKQMIKYYEHTKNNHDHLSLYVPLLEKTYQGYFLKRAALIIDDNQLYIEAFRQKKNEKQEQISIPVKYGEKFVIDRQTNDKNKLSITMDSTFSGQYYRFSVVNHPEMINRINQAKRGGK
jgi:ABC-type multidrug transport system fused ATPase/permease subunit